MYRSPWRRVAFIVASVIVPIIANGMRAVGIVALGHVLGSAKAAATDHVLYGWLFFSLVILMLIALGLPFREDIGPTRGPARSVACGASGRAVGDGIGAGRRSPASWSIARRCQSGGGDAARPRRPTANGRRTGAEFRSGLHRRRVRDADAVGCRRAPRHAAHRLRRADLDVQIVVFGVHSTAAPVLAAERVLTVIPNITHDENFETESVRLPVTGGAANPWRLIRSTRPGPMVAVAIWVDGKPAGGGLRMRARLAWESLMGAPTGPVLVTVRPEQKRYLAADRSRPRDRGEAGKHAVTGRSGGADRARRPGH